MTNEERQKKLEEQRSIKSKKIGVDMRGAMTYCYFCDSRKYFLCCKASKNKMQIECLCAIAYDIMMSEKLKFKGVK